MILEQVSKRPSYGYDMASILGVSISTVYEHLRELEEHGLVESRREGRRKVYRLTEKGEYLAKALGIK